MRDQLFFSAHKKVVGCFLQNEFKLCDKCHQVNCPTDRKKAEENRLNEEEDFLLCSSTGQGA